MGKFDSIIRVRKFELDEQRRGLRAAEDALIAHDHTMQDLADQVANAAEGVDIDIAAFALGSFLEGARKRQSQLAEERLPLAEVVEQKRALVRNAFQDLKTIEIAAEQEAQRERHERDVKEQNALDEISIQAHIRRTRR